MSFVTILMVGGWSATIGMIGFCALKESGKLAGMRRRLVLWLDSTAYTGAGLPEDGLRRDVARARG